MRSLPARHLHRAVAHIAFWDASEPQAELLGAGFRQLLHPVGIAHWEEATVFELGVGGGITGFHLGVAELEPALLGGFQALQKDRLGAVFFENLLVGPVEL